MAHDTHHHHKESFFTKYIFSQDHKMIGKQRIIGLALHIKRISKWLGKDEKELRSFGNDNDLDSFSIQAMNLFSNSLKT